ncbi:hypothetical protein IV203_022132 [Nitzschia inconspicua]|uniref:Uncharacterized protein n=1 Tax=Nitzschia inconspicua TaxID=303405 RepID=A0A9K3KJH3_9STRA|nr:hypothetical protein IV203_022132 [Nitzschia inconspicua]
MKTLTFEQTLRPECISADGSPADSPWETFFREARGDIPIAIAEPIDENPEPVTQPEDNFVNAEVVVLYKDGPSGMLPTRTANEKELEGQQSQRCAGKACFYHEGLVGSILALSVTLIVFSLEMCGAVVYLFAVGFNLLSSEESGMPFLFKVIISLVVNTLMLADSICLFCSVLWHQYIRKMGHLARWSFRSLHSGWKPERVFPWRSGGSNTSSSSAVQTCDNGSDDDRAVIYLSTASIVVEPEPERTTGGSSSNKGSSVSIASAPLAPGEIGTFDASRPNVSIVMPDDPKPSWRQHFEMH